MSVESQVPVPGYMPLLLFMNLCFCSLRVQKGFAGVVQPGLCLKTNLHQRRDAVHSRFRGIAVLNSRDSCSLQARGYFGADVLFMLLVEAGILHGREFKTVG